MSPMKWVIRTFGTIIGLFVLAAVAGYFMSPTIEVERSTQVYGDPEDIFTYFSDLEDYQAWSPWQGQNSHEEYVVGGADEGVGQQAAWNCMEAGCLPGTQEITIIHYPEFVQASLNLDGKDADATYALMPAENNDGSVTLLVKVDLHIGDFPYVQRLLTFNQKADLEYRLDTALSRLTSLINQDSAPG